MYRSNFYLCANFNIIFAFFSIITVARNPCTGLLHDHRDQGGRDSQISEQSAHESS